MQRKRDGKVRKLRKYRNVRYSNLKRKKKLFILIYTLFGINLINLIKSKKKMVIIFAAKLLPIQIVFKKFIFNVMKLKYIKV